MMIFWTRWMKLFHTIQWNKSIKRTWQLSYIICSDVFRYAYLLTQNRTIWFIQCIAYEHITNYFYEQSNVVTHYKLINALARIFETKAGFPFDEMMKSFKLVRERAHANNRVYVCVYMSNKFFERITNIKSVDYINLLAQFSVLICACNVCCYCIAIAYAITVYTFHCCLVSSDPSNSRIYGSAVEMLRYYQRHEWSAFHSTGLLSLLVDCRIAFHVNEENFSIGRCRRSIFPIHISYRFSCECVCEYFEMFMFCLCNGGNVDGYKDDCHECLWVVLYVVCFSLPYHDVGTTKSHRFSTPSCSFSLSLFCSLFSPFISHLCRFVTSMCNLVRANHLLTLFFNF